MSNITILDQPFEGELQTPFAFKLDDFQKHSYKLINDDTTKNILCCAHTGSGKSMLIEFCILRAKKINKKIFYCSPIKTLSNQKFYEFTQKYPDISIGLITGDHKCNPDADCLIMTTEILCNLLIYKTLKYDDFEINNIDFNDFFAVVFDEVHYINDVERGGVWEKCIMNMPKHINQVMLSATIDKPENFINWVYSCNNNPSYLLTNEKRVVPLHFNYSYWVNNSKLSKELEKYASKINTFTEFTSTSTKVKEIDRMHCLTMDSLNKYFVDVKVNFTFIINEICKQLQVKHMTPAIFFIFSKRKCMEIAKSISTNFNDYNEGVEVGRLFDYYLSKLEQKEAYKNSQQYNVIRDLAIKGISVHHAGLIPVFKEIIEMLFSKNLIKVLFATETFAVGLNMPTKTVIFTDIYKFDNRGKRRLMTHEFIQMSGRAGRRGIDKIGYVIIIPQLFSDETNVKDLQNLLFGKSQSITSKFNIDHDFILNLIENNALDKLKDNMNKSLLNSEIVKEIDYIEKDIEVLEDKISKISISNMEQYNDYQKLEDQLTNIITPSQNQIKKIEQKIKDMKKSDIFMKEFGKYQELRQLDNEKNILIIDKKNTINYIERNVNNQINMLKDEGFITEDNMLTQKGQIARKIKEIDTISTTNILVSDYLDMLFKEKKLNKILALFTLLCDGKDSDDYEITEEYHDVLKFIRENSNILINRELLYPVLDWYDGKYSRDIVETYNIHEGDLIKSINKIIHLLDDVIQVFMLINKIEYIDIITEIKNKLIGDSTRNIITMESLYLKIV
jgi:superfamily II RNA helicase